MRDQEQKKRVATQDAGCIAVSNDYYYQFKALKPIL